MTADADREISDLVAKLHEAFERLEPEIDAGLTLGSRLREATRRIADSSSNSWAGWHSRMYYGDYQEPPVRDSWDVEWGGIHGYSDLWQERSLSEIQQAIEDAAGTTLAELAAAADSVREECEGLADELVTLLSPVCDREGFEREAELVRKIEAVDWITPPAQYIRALAPRQYMSRDSRALSQGLQPPLHLNVEAAIVSNTTTLATCRTFLQDARRVARQSQIKLADLPASRPAQSAAAANSNNGLAMRLLVISWSLFLILAAAVVAGLVYLQRTRDLGSLLAAVVIAGGGALVLGLYALLLDRDHAKRALGAAIVAAGAIAALDQLLAHLD